MREENRNHAFLNEKPAYVSQSWDGYRLYVWHDGPMIFSLGNYSRRYFYQALAEDERSKAAKVIPYLVVPMTAKREKDVANNKLSLRQAVLHSGGKVFKTYDNGQTFETIDVISESEICEKGVRLDFQHPAWLRKLRKRTDGQKLLAARKRKASSTR